MGPHCLCKSRWQLKKESLLGVVPGGLAVGPWHALLACSLPLSKALCLCFADPPSKPVLAQLQVCLWHGLNNGSPGSGSFSSCLSA